MPKKKKKKASPDLHLSATLSSPLFMNESFAFAVSVFPPPLSSHLGHPAPTPGAATLIGPRQTFAVRSRGLFLVFIYLTNLTPEATFSFWKHFCPQFLRPSLSSCFSDFSSISSASISLIDHS